MKSRPFLEDLLFCLEKFGASSPLHRILLFSNSIEVLLFFYFPPPPLLGYTKGLESFFPDFHPTLVLELCHVLAIWCKWRSFCPHICWSCCISESVFVFAFYAKTCQFCIKHFNCCQNISDKNPNIPNELCYNIIFGKVAFKVKVSVFHKRHLTVKYTFSCRVKQRPLEYK